MLGPIDWIMDTPNCWFDRENRSFALLGLITEAWKIPDDWGNKASGHTDRQLVLPRAKKTKPALYFITVSPLSRGSSLYLQGRKYFSFLSHLSSFSASPSFTYIIRVYSSLVVHMINVTIKHNFCTSFSTNMILVKCSDSQSGKHSYCYK